MKSYLTFLFVLVVNCVLSQIYTPDTNSYKSFIKVEFDVEYENGAFNNEFIDAIFSNEFIPRELRVQNINNQSIQNQFGLNFIQSNEAYLRKRYGLELGFDWRYSLYGDYNQDLMELIFLGNSDFADEPINIARTEITQFNHQRFLFGIYDQFNNSYFNLAIGKGTRFTKAQFNSASILTEENGAYLDFNWQGNYFDTPNSKWTDFNGLSITTDFKYYLLNRPTEKRKFLNILSLEVKHLGVMNWSKINETQIDTTFRFRGFELGNFLDDSFTFPNQSALEDSIIPSSRPGSYTQFLPFNIIFSTSSLRESGISYGFEFEQWVNMHARPSLRFQLGYLARRNFKLNAEYSVGGYQQSKIGFSFEWEINYSWYWKIGTHHFIDNFDNNGLGRSVFVILKRDIR